MQREYKFTSISSLYKDYKPLLNTQITVNGWVRTIRDSKTFGFIELNDWSCLKNLQVVFEDNLPNFAEICKFGVCTSLIVEGTLVESQWWKQAFELKASKVILVWESPVDYPLQKKGHSMEYLRTIAHLRPRTNTFSATFRVRSLIAFAIHKFFNERGFVYVHTPLITASDCEWAGEMFQVTTLDLEHPNLKWKDWKVDYSNDFFGKHASLTVSGQLEWETFATAFGKIYTFWPTFRAENSNTTRHASEFWMIEPEIAFADITDNMDLTEDLLKYVFQYVLDNAQQELDFFTRFINPEVKERLEKFTKADFGRITYTKAIEILEKSGKKFEYPVHWWMDMQTEHERYLAEEYFKGPVFVIDYPKEIKAFYMRENDDGKTVAACDLLVPAVGELVGGSQREERYDILLKKMQKLGNDKELDWYLDTRRYGGCKHSGFGIGFDRLLMYITGMQNIRDVQPYPRTSNSIKY